MTGHGSEFNYWDAENADQCPTEDASEHWCFWVVWLGWNQFWLSLKIFDGQPLFVGQTATKHENE